MNDEVIYYHEGYISALECLLTFIDVEKATQEQLKEANEVIKSFYWKDRGQASSYCKKWGVK